MNMTKSQFEEAIDKAAEKGAEKALDKIGLSDKYAGEDIRNLRGLLKTFKMVEKTFWQTVVKVGTTALLACFVLGAAIKLKFLGL